MGGVTVLSKLVIVYLRLHQMAFPPLNHIFLIEENLYRKDLTLVCRCDDLEEPGFLHKAWGGGYGLANSGQA